MYSLGGIEEASCAADKFSGFAGDLREGREEPTASLSDGFPSDYCEVLFPASWTHAGCVLARPPRAFYLTRALGIDAERDHEMASGPVQRGYSECHISIAPQDPAP